VELVENRPVDTAPLGEMVRDREDLFLLWPRARWPFDPEQWREVLDPAGGILSFWVREGGRTVGHAALDEGGDPATRMARFLYLIPEVRGSGRRLLGLLEAAARERFQAERLTLRVRSYNARALRCYERGGFSELFREGTLITMGKEIPPDGRAPGAAPGGIDRAEALRWLLAGEGELEELWERADRVRRENVGEAVHLRGLLEISSHCVRGCAYCGLRAENPLPRYRMTEEEILEGARRARALGYGTVVLQAGEDPALTGDRVARLVRRVKGETGLAVTLSLGERSREELAAWREAGADRYLLRFETSDRELFRRIHPPKSGEAEADRIGLLRELRGLDYEVGSGVMVGIPGQTVRSLAEDLELFRSLDLDMIGIGPFLPHPDTPLGRLPVVEAPPEGPDSPVPNDALMTCRMVALARLFCPDANIPSTTALATVDRAGGRELGLRRGANVFMPNLTPPAYRNLYRIYPGKSETPDSALPAREELTERLRALGRTVGVGPGSAPARARRART